MEASTAGSPINPAFTLHGSAVRAPAGAAEEIETLEQAEELCLQRRFRQALGVLNRLVAGDPGNARAWMLVAGAHAGRGEHAEALEAARTAARYTSDSEPLRMAAAALVALDRLEEAVEQAEQAVRREPHDWRNHVELARTLLNMPDRLAEARSAARAAVNLAPHKVTTHLVSGQVELAAGDNEAAAEAFRQVFTIDSANPVAYSELARLRLNDAPTGFASRLRRSISRSNRWQ